MTKPLALLALYLGACVNPDGAGNLVPATVDQDPSLPQITLNGSTFHAESFGPADAPIVITLHGGPGSDYRSILELMNLADHGYKVVFWDQRGAGLSQRFSADHYTLAEYLEDLRLLVEHYTTVPNQPFVFIGHSWGAMYATWFINEYGDYNGRLKGAILSEPGAFTKAQLDEFLDAIQAEIALTGERLNDATWSRQFMSASDHERADYLYGALSYGGLPSEAADPNHLAPFWRRGAVVQKATMDIVDKEGFDWTTNLAAFPTKVLFLRGEKNTVVTLEHQQRLAASFPTSEVITIPGVGHEMVWDAPDAYLEHTLTYFRDINFPGATP